MDPRSTNTKQAGRIFMLLCLGISLSACQENIFNKKKTANKVPSVQPLVPPPRTPVPPPPLRPPGPLTPPPPVILPPPPGGGGSNTPNVGGGPVIPSQPPVVTTPPPRSEPPVRPNPPIDSQPPVGANPPVGSQPPVGTTPPVVPSNPGQPPIPTTPTAPGNGPLLPGGMPGGVIVGGGGGGTPVAIRPMPGVSNVPQIQGAARVIQPRRAGLLDICGRSEDCAPQKVIAELSPLPQPKLGCPKYCEPVVLSNKVLTNKVDILFVVDTSASMLDERAEIARQTSEFVKELGKDVDYQIAVLLGHGPRSKAGLRVGELFRSKKGQSVLKKSDYSRLGSEAATAQGIANDLRETMLQLPNDSSEAQGEAGLLNLYKAFSETSGLRRDGFLRDEAALAVIFVADENDVCYEYKTGETGNYATEKDRADEMKAFNDYDTCRGVAEGRRLTPEIVFNTLKSSKKDMPVILTGILYLDNNSIPKRSDKFAKDNEMGRGYLDLIALGHGRAADLSQTNFGLSLAKLGGFAELVRKHEFAFSLTGLPKIQTHEFSTIQVEVRNPKSGERKLINKRITLGAQILEAYYLIQDEKNNAIELVFTPEVLAELYKNGTITHGSEILVSYVPTSCAEAGRSAPAGEAPRPFTMKSGVPNGTAGAEVGGAQGGEASGGDEAIQIDPGYYDSLYRGE